MRHLKAKKKKKTGLIRRTRWIGQLTANISYKFVKNGKIVHINSNERRSFK